MATKAKKYQPTAAQQRAFRRSTSFGVLFIRGRSINQVRDANGNWVMSRYPDQPVVLSVRRFGSQEEATIHGRRFKKLEGHKNFFVVLQNSKPNAWVNLKTGKTNPLIGRKRKR